MTDDINGNAVFSRAFRHLADGERALLLEKARKQSLASGQAIIEEGSAISAVYVIASGRVRISHRVAGSVSAEIVGPRGPGEILGEMSYIDGQSASATLVADGDVEVFRIDYPDIDSLVAGNDGFAMRLYHSLLISLCQRLRATNARVFTSTA